MTGGVGDERPFMLDRAAFLRPLRTTTSTERNPADAVFYVTRDWRVLSRLAPSGKEAIVAKLADGAFLEKTCLVGGRARGTARP